MNIINDVIYIISPDKQINRGSLDLDANRSKDLYFNADKGFPGF